MDDLTAMRMSDSYVQSTPRTAMNRLFQVFVSALLICSALWSPMVPAAETAAQKNHTLGAAEPLSIGSLIQVTLGLLAVVVTIFALAWFLRRYGRFQSAANTSLKVVGGLSVGPRERVVLIQVEDRQLLLGVAPGRVQMLHTLDGRVPAVAVKGGEEAAPKKHIFASLLKSG